MENLNIGAAGPVGFKWSIIRGDAWIFRFFVKDMLLYAASSKSQQCSIIN